MYNIAIILPNYITSIPASLSPSLMVLFSWYGWQILLGASQIGLVRIIWVYGSNCKGHSEPTGYRIVYRDGVSSGGRHEELESGGPSKFRLRMGPLYSPIHFLGILPSSEYRPGIPCLSNEPHRRSITRDRSSLLQLDVLQLDG